MGNEVPWQSHSLRKSTRGGNRSWILLRSSKMCVRFWSSAGRARMAPKNWHSGGFTSMSRGGPGPTDYSVYELSDGRVVARHIGRPPERAELVYSYRPLSELPQIVARAKALQAETIWTQSGLRAAGTNDPKGCWVPEQELELTRQLVESAGLRYLSEPYIGDAVRKVAARR